MDLTIAIDAMGGDFGPEVTVPAALSCLSSYPDLNLILVGDSDILEKVLGLHAVGEACSRVSIRHASQQVSMDEPPSSALRFKKDSSMRVAVTLVKQGVAQACVSAGNTGALMATARFVLKTLPGLDRPAIMAKLPTVLPDRYVRMLDLGANVDSQAEHLYQFGVMGSVFSEVIDGIDRPKIALLNIGEEQIKGNETVKEAAALLSKHPSICYHGYIEANELFSGSVDVVVCDGFVGNIALKSMEGIANVMRRYMKEEFQRTLCSRLSALISIPVLRRVAKRTDPRRHNGATLLGLRGIVIKSHGSADVEAFSQAISEAILQARAHIPSRISESVTRFLAESS